MRASISWLLVASACSFRAPAGDPEAVTDGAIDSALDAAPLLPIAFTKEPTRIDPIASAGAESDPSLTRDELELFFRSDRADGVGGEDIWVSTRKSITEPWGPPIDVAEVNSIGNEREPAISPDGLTLRFSRNDGTGPDVFVATRATRMATFSEPTSVAEFADYYDAQEDDSGLRAVLSTPVNANEELFIARRPMPSGAFGAPVILAELNTAVAESAPFLFDDGLAICFDRHLPSGRDIFVAYRESLDEPFGEAVPIPGLNHATLWDSDCWLSTSRKTLYFASERAGVRKIFYVTAD